MTRNRLFPGVSLLVIAVGLSHVEGRAPHPSFQESTEKTEAPLAPRWDRYHDSEAVAALLRSWATLFPEITRLYSIGETLKGSPLWILEITNRATGDALEKPGYYYDGNIHSEELASAEVVLYFAWTILENYGRDSAITDLVDTRTLYMRPKFNPDGADLALKSTHNPRSTPRPYDEDADGLLDEDPPNDLDGDGFITRMRVASTSGEWKLSSEDPRTLVRRNGEGTDGPFFDVYSEGVDDDEDGAFNEDGVGGIDMNRNFPRNWAQEFEQRGAGPYSLSEPETRATIEFLHSHRNVCGAFHGHTHGGFVYRLPSTTSWDDYDLGDQSLILELASKYEDTTGQRVVPSYSDPRRHRHGTLISWLYWDYGVVGFVPELWGGFGRDDDEDGTVSEAERHAWNDRELGGAGFAPWRTFEHPQLGEVEIGGWRTRFTTRNPPPRFLEAEIRQYVPWMGWLAKICPQVRIREFTSEPVAAEIRRVRVTVENVGYLPTHITERAIENETAVPVRGRWELTQAELMSGALRVDLGHLKGTRDTAGPRGRYASRATIEGWIRATGPKPALQITVVSEKGGTDRRNIPLR